MRFRRIEGRKGQTISDKVYRRAGVERERGKVPRLPRYSSLGGYPLFYVDYDGAVICPHCVNTASWLDKFIIDVDVNYEDAGLYCEECNERIESAYCEAL